MGEAKQQKNVSSWTCIQLTACIMSAALLIFLFIFPSTRLTALEKALVAHANKVELLAMQQKWSDAAAEAELMLHRLQCDQNLLRLVLDHEDTDMLELHVTNTVKLTAVEELGQLLCELESVKNVVKYIANIERVSLEGVF